MGWFYWWYAENRRRAFKDAVEYDPTNIHGAAGWATDKMLDDARKFKPEGIPLGYSLDSGKQIYSGVRSPHAITLGPTGLFKTTGGLIPAALSDSLRDTTIVVPDIAAEMACTTAHFRQRFGESIIVDPLHMFPDLLRGLKRGFYNALDPRLMNPADRYFSARAAKVSALCISKVKGKEQYWYNSARLAMQAVIMAECKYGRKPTLPKVARILNDDFPRYAQYRIRTVADEEIKSLFRRWADPRAASGDIHSLTEVIETIRTETAFLLDRAIGETLSDLNFSFAAERVMSVYIPLAHEVLDGSLAKYFKLLSGCGLSETLRLSGPRTVRKLFILDELYQLDLEDLPLIFSGARKFSVAVWGVLQDIGQLKEMHPKTFETVLNNCGCIQVMGAQDLEGSEYVSKRLGKMEVHGFAKSLNYNPTEFSLGPESSKPEADVNRFTAPSYQNLQKLHVTQNYTQQARPLLLDQEVRALPEDRQILLFSNMALPVLAKTIPYFKTKANKRARPNPYYRPAKKTFWGF
jgi:type IV secretion system protein VirD4